MTADPMNKPQFDKRKFRELVVYFARKGHDDPNFGAVKLNKLLFVTDFAAYAKVGKPVTGASYFRLPYGPAPRQMLPVAREMEELRDIATEFVDRYGKTQKRPVALREPDLSVFEAAEIAIADEALQLLREANAAEVSSWTHAFRGWQVADDKEDIPYESIFLADDALPPLLLEHAKDVVARHGGWKKPDRTHKAARQRH